MALISASFAYISADFVDTVEEFEDPMHVTFMDREQRVENSQRRTVAMLEMEKSGKIKLNDLNDVNLFRQFVQLLCM